MTQIEQKQHARLSPSSAKRWMTCPGSIKLVESLNIENKSSKYAAEGTVAHEVHELCLRNGEVAANYLGKTFESDGFEFKVNDNMVDAVQESLDYIADKIYEWESQGDGRRVEVKVEVRCSLTPLGIPGLDGGTSDTILLFWDDDVLMQVEVFDYKHGQGVAVEATDNPQAMCYALGTILLPELNGHGIPDGIVVTISQPRAHHPDGRIRNWETTKEELLNWQDDKLVPSANACHEEGAAIVPSDDGCRFCGAAGQCPKLYDKTQEIAIADFSDDSFPLPKLMTTEQKMVVLDHMGMLRGFIIAVEEQVRTEVDHGSKEYEGRYKLVRKATQRKLTEDALDELCSPLLDFMEEEDMYVQKPKGIGDLEKTLKTKLKEQGIKGFVKIAKEIMGDITIKPEGDLVIAPQSDKRKAAQPTVVSDFTDLGD